MNFEELQTIKTVETAMKHHGQEKKNDSCVRARKLGYYI